MTNAYTGSPNSLIRAMGRVGRGYSFEALRAKMLFAEGAHKHTLSRLKFERKQRGPVAVEESQRCDFYVPDMARALPDEIGRMPSAPKPTREPSTKAPKNYGADLSTLERLTEDGEL